MRNESSRQSNDEHAKKGGPFSAKNYAQEKNAPSLYPAEHANREK
jgi:hypothetical protein